MARDLTEGSIPRHVITLAVPAVFSMFAIVLNNLVDTALVGHLGASQVAAVGSAGFVIWLIFSVTTAESKTIALGVIGSTRGSFIRHIPAPNHQALEEGKEIAEFGCQYIHVIQLIIVRSPCQPSLSTD